MLIKEFHKDVATTATGSGTMRNLPLYPTEQLDRSLVGFSG